MQNQNNKTITTHLFIGKQDILIEKTFNYLQKELCPNNQKQENNSCFCSICRKIKNLQHENVLWINPETNYKTDDLDIIFEKIRFALDNDAKFFFILQKAQTLNLTCANRLLKILEEPAIGYNFIIHTNNINSIIPTIKSRCFITNYSQNLDDYQEEQNPLLDFFYNHKLNNPIEFDKTLKSLGLTDTQTKELADIMLNFYTKKILDFYKDPETNLAEKNNLKYYQNIIDFLKEKLKKPAQSGSSNIFWKNLYISFPKK